MPNTNPSPNMGLPIPVIGQETGPQWASDVNNSLTLIDAHTHSPGSGVPITPSGMNITIDLPFNGNNATTLRSVRFSPQGSAISGASDLCCFYVVGADVWYNDGNANQIQLTSGGSVNATSSGISSGSATASFVSGVLVVNAAANTPATIQGASILLGNNVANSKFLTLSPPSSMAANYSLTLPSIPAATNFVTIDTSGNIAGSIPISQGITASNIASATITTTQISASAGITGGQIANNTITRNNEAAVGQQISSSSGTFSTGSGSFTQVTNLSVSITTSGRPVVVSMIPTPGLNPLIGQISGISMTGSPGTGVVGLFRGGSILGSVPCQTSSTLGLFGPSQLFTVDPVSSGTYTYTIQAVVTSGSSQISVLNYLLMAYEL